ncbi:MAG: MBL fold metallo-hydrolase, partial [Candidatus Hydrogenedentes bacterium]|nr:MBL fold metallo-hydrolase [Candidatus Hydrogenedentota bacterium]
PILTLAAISTATGFIWPAAAIVFNGANKLLIMALLAATRFLGSIPGFHIEVPPPPVFSVFLYYAALAVLVAKRRREPSSSRTVTDQTDVRDRRDRTIRMRRRAAVSAIIFALAVLAWALPLDRRPSTAANGSVPFTGDTLRVTVLNVGQGDSILVEFPEGQTMLVDAGPAWREGDAGASIVVPFLRANGIRHLDAVVVTHGHNDHVGGMASVLDMVRTGTVFSTGVPWDIPAYHRFIDVVHNKNIPFKTLVAGDRLDFGDRVVVETLYPEPADIKMYTSNPNDTSLVLKITFGTTRILLTADMTGLVENLLLERGVSVRSDVLKVPHNGSVYSSTPKFLHAASPMLAVLPVGADNRFGFPSAELVDRYRKAGIMLLRTDRDGHIRIDTDGTRIRWTTSTGKTGILRRVADPVPPVARGCPPRFHFYVAGSN